MRVRAPALWRTFTSVVRMRGRCAWTGKLADHLKEVRLTVPDRFGSNPHEETFLVAPEHEGELRTYTERLTRHSRHFFLLMTAGVLAAIVFALLRSIEGIAASFVGMGIIGLACPFATPETVQMVGVRRSRQIARAGGVLVIALGIGMLMLA